MAAFRYPGAKTQLAQQILRAFPSRFREGPLFGSDAPPLDYREPFFGAGGVGLRVMESLPWGTHVWLNDADPGIANYWRCVAHDPAALQAKIQACTPTVAQYRACLAMTGDPALSVLESAFCTVVLHQCSYSGLGKKAGSPIGGWQQDTRPKRYDVACRWKPQKLIADITHWHTVFRNYRLTITCGDFAPLLTDIPDPGRVMVYCDPPYVQRGAALYHIAMTEDDHTRLATALQRLPCPWILSYDDAALVRRLYRGCVIHEIPVRYRVANGTARGTEASSGHELLITPPPPCPRWSVVVPGRTGYPYAQLAQETGLPATTIRNRIRRGWTMAQALDRPRRAAPLPPTRAREPSSHD